MLPQKIATLKTDLVECWRKRYWRNRSQIHGGGVDMGTAEFAYPRLTTIHRKTPIHPVKC
jgi:hypothetical protein